MIVDGNVNPLTVIGGQNSNTFIQSGTQLANVTFDGGPAGSQNIFQVEPNNNYNDTVVSHGGFNTLDITQAFLPTTLVQKPGATPDVIGETVDMNLDGGQSQIIYNIAAFDPDIGSLIHPSLLVSNSTASLSLQGTIQTVIAGNDDTLFAVPATISGTTPEPGTTVVLAGAGNTVFGAQGSTVLAFGGGNHVTQSSDQATVNAANASSPQRDGGSNSTSTAPPPRNRPTLSSTPRPSPSTSSATRDAPGLL